MNKQDLINEIQIRCDRGLHKTEIAEVLDTLAKLVLLQLQGGGEITLPGIGKLVAKHRPARSGRNPRTGEPVAIPGHWAAAFHPAKALKEGINP